MTAKHDLADIQQTLKLRFDDQSLLKRALTHRSYINEHPDDALDDNERLEFLGDAVLDFITGEWLYHRFPEMREGRLTRLRAALVRTENLADLGVQCSLGDAILLGRGEEESGGRERQANLCCAFEALIGALYLDQGIEAVKKFVLPRFEPALQQILRTDADKDAKSLLQEWSQAQLGLTPTYRTVQATGPDHNKEFTVEVVIGDKVYGRGVGHSKQIAAQEAARNALQHIETDANQGTGGTGSTGQRCPYCQRTEGQVKAGRNASGSQRFKCQFCQRKYTPKPNPQGYSGKVRHQAIQMYRDGMSFRQIARTLRVAHRTVINWINDYVAQHAEQSPASSKDPGHSEADKQSVAAGRRKKKSTP